MSYNRIQDVIQSYTKCHAIVYKMSGLVIQSYEMRSIVYKNYLSFIREAMNVESIDERLSELLQHEIIDVTIADGSADDAEKVRSENETLRSENEELRSEKTNNSSELLSAKNAIIALQARLIETEKEKDTIIALQAQLIDTEKRLTETEKNLANAEKALADLGLTTEGANTTAKLYQQSYTPAMIMAASKALHERCVSYLHNHNDRYPQSIRDLSGLYELRAKWGEDIINEQLFQEVKSYVKKERVFVRGTIEPQEGEQIPETQTPHVEQEGTTNGHEIMTKVTQNYVQLHNRYPKKIDDLGIPQNQLKRLFHSDANAEAILMDVKKDLKHKRSRHHKDTELLQKQEPSSAATEGEQNQ